MAQGWSAEWDGLHVQVQENASGEVVSVSICSAAEGGVVRPGHASRVPIARLVAEEHQRRLERQKDEHRHLLGTHFMRLEALGSEYLRPFAEDRRGRRGAPRTDRDWAGLAVAYEWAHALDAERDARAIVSKWMEEAGGSRRTWNNRTSQARRRGYLTAEGRATRTALDLLGLTLSPRDQVKDWADSDQHFESYIRAMENLERWERGELDADDLAAIIHAEKADRRRAVNAGGPRHSREQITAAYLRRRQTETRKDLGLPEHGA